MEPRNVLKQALLLIGGAIGAFVVMMGLLFVIFFIGFRIAESRAERKLLQGAKVGSTKAEVMERLGKPRWLVTKQSELDVMGKGWDPIPQYPIEKEVLVYSERSYRVYAYINKEGRVTRAVLAVT